MSRKRSPSPSQPPFPLPPRGNGGERRFLAMAAALAGAVDLSYRPSMRKCATFCLLYAALLIFAPGGTARADQTIRVGVRPTSPPFSFLTKINGERTIRGLSVDEYMLIGKALDARIEFVMATDLEECTQFLLDGKIDVMNGSAGNAARLGLACIPMSLSLRHHLYVHKSCKSVTCLRDLADKRTVTIKKAPYAEGIKVQGDVVQVGSPLEALDMLDRGVVDVYLAPSERVADFLIDTSRFKNILKKGIVLGEVPLGLLVRSERIELIKDLQTAVNRLQDSGLLAQLKDKWFGKSASDMGLSRYYKHFAAGATAILSAFIAFTLWNVSLKRRVAKVANDLKRTEQRYRDLIESSPDMIFLVTAKGDILHANERARDNLDLPAPNAPSDFRQLVPDGETGEVTAFLDKVYNDGCDKYEFVLNAKNGQPMEVEVAGRILQGPMHPELLACLFARNVTERNRMERELIQSERLGIIGKMAASVAHEVNNPLGIIQANAEDLLYAGEVSGDTREGLEAIRRNAVRAGEITTGLLDLASPKPMANQVINLEDVVSESVTLLGPRTKKHRLEVRFPKEEMLIRGDSRSLQQVVVNLVLNALESMHEKGTVVISGRIEGPEDAKTVRLVVRDQGSGIPTENLTNIFEPFFSSRKSGFGLGLFITRRIVELHGGIIFAESSPGKGTSMFVELPIHTREEA